MRALVLAMLVLFAGCASRAPIVERGSETAVLDVRFTDLGEGGGVVIAAVYPDETLFEAQWSPVATARLDVEDGSAVWTLELREGDYAIKAYHDLNGNGELDRGVVGQPVEPYGFSNDARGSLGPPGWKAARFSLRPPAQSMEIRLR